MLLIQLDPSESAARWNDLLGTALLFGWKHVSVAWGSNAHDAYDTVAKSCFNLWLSGAKGLDLRFCRVIPTPSFETHRSRKTLTKKETDSGEMLVNMEANLAGEAARESFGVQVAPVALAPFIFHSAVGSRLRPRGWCLSWTPDS